MTESLRQKLLSADVVCKDCGARYGKYSVGVSSTWMGDCDVCGEHKGVTEVRDWGYLTKGIQELKGAETKPFADIKARIKEQSAKVAEAMAKADNFIKEQNPAVFDYIMTDEELDEELTASYEVGKLTLKLTEEEVGFLNECLDTLQEFHPSLQFGAEDGPFDVPLFESVEEKITDLYADECVQYTLSPAFKKFYELYGAYPGENDAKWEGFRDAYNLLNP